MPVLEVQITVLEYYKSLVKFIHVEVKNLNLPLMAQILLANWYTQCKIILWYSNVSALFTSPLTCRYRKTTVTKLYTYYFIGDKYRIYKNLQKHQTLTSIFNNGKSSSKPIFSFNTDFILALFSYATLSVRSNGSFKSIHIVTLRCLHSECFLHKFVMLKRTPQTFTVCGLYSLNFAGKKKICNNLKWKY